MWTRRTGGAWYVPDLKRSSSDWRFSSRFAAYSVAVWPSTPGAPSLRVRRYASCNQSRSMWWASDVNAISGASFASSAIRWSFVETVCGTRCLLPSFPPAVPCPAPPSLHRVPRVGSPASSVLRGAPTSCCPSRRTSFPSLGGTVVALAFAPHRSSASRVRPGLLALAGSPTALVGGDNRTSQVPGEPSCAYAPSLFDPGGISAPGRFGASAVAFRLKTQASAPTFSFISGLNRTASCSLSTLRSRGHPWPRKTRFRLVANLGRAGFIPAGSRREVSGHVLYMPPPTQALPGALPAETSTGLRSHASHPVAPWRPNCMHPAAPQQRHCRRGSLNAAQRIEPRPEPPCSSPTERPAASLPNDTGVQRRTREGAKRPTRPSAATPVWVLRSAFLVISAKPRKSGRDMHPRATNLQRRARDAH